MQDVNSQVQSISSQLLYDDSQLQEANAQVTSLNSDVTNLNDTILSLKSHPTLAMWTGCGGNSACPMVSGEWWEEVVPDTFELDISFTSTVPVNVYIFTLPQFVQFYKCGGSVSCVSGTYFSFGPTTSLQNVAFGYGEGCGDYVAIFQSLSDGVFYPGFDGDRSMCIGNRLRILRQLHTTMQTVST